MTDNQLTPAELKTLAFFELADLPSEIDPAHFAKLLSLAMLEQKEGGPVLTETGRARLAMGASPLP
ncbi:MAG: hypothetical protein P0Y65_00310 [Candidatus Devosia phytovorans]|uniref:Uncharacterized protein n=1 Tax=Candidatus Devosia phytovorans TaxID=3121372 RepID=A0AAJ5VUV4_9HYPH|nr:hypothetical protein [Devosia sp.]WEK04737.1 MAG: hypothetical protein P0Y65_00310 [Devosia sp.]